MITVSPVLDEFVSSGDGGDGWAELRQRFFASVVPGLEYDFSEAGDVLLEVIWQAPAGQHFVLEFPEAATWGSSLGMGWQRTTSGDFGPDLVHFTDGSVSATGATGGLVVPGPGIGWISDNADPQFNVQLGSTQPLGQTITFSAITFTATIPASYAQNLNVAAADLFYLQAYAEGPTLPGGRYDLLSLQPIPEPSTYAALAGATGEGLRGLWRRDPCEL